MLCLLPIYTLSIVTDLDNILFFCLPSKDLLSVQVVEEYASRWQVPLPQLRILEIALCYFTRASTLFTSSCDHVLHTLSSLAL